MNKILIVLSTILLYIPSAYCQISLSIDTLYISNVKYLLTDNNDEKFVEIYSEDKGNGPYITVSITFENLSTDTLFVDSILDFTHEDDTIIKMINNGIDGWSTKHSDNGGLYLTFYYNSKIYELMPAYIYPIDRKPVLPGNKQKLKFGDWLFLGTDIFKDFYGANYNKEVIESLPTLQVVFEYEDKIYRSYGIKEVKYIGK